MRMFIALPLPPDVQRALYAAQAQLRQVACGGRYVPKENFHITLHFIGKSKDLAGAAAACDEAVRGIKPCLLRLAGFARFEQAGKYTAIINLEGDLQELRRLHETLVSALMERGFPLSGGHKRFTPHITLARALSAGENKDAYLHLRLDAKEGAAFTANQLVLYQSENRQGAMVYTPLHRSAFS